MRRTTSTRLDGPPAVVVGLGSMVGLQAARLLHARGVRVVGITGDRAHFAARTRACDEVFEADVHGDGFVAVLEDLAPGFDAAPVLVPCTDNAVLAVSRHRARLEPAYRIALPDDAVVRTLADKARFAEHAERHGLPIPRTVVVRSADDARRAAETLRYPALVKPPVKTPAWVAHTNAKALRVDDADALLRTCERVAGWAEALVVQEMIPGGDDALFTCNACFAAGSEPLVTFVTRKARQWPPHLGIASFAREAREPAVEAATLALFSTLDFRGLGYLEVKRDADGTLRMIEANVGRPTGRSATAEAGGVELLATLYADAAGLPLPAARTQRHVGAGWIDLRRDLLSAAYYWRRGELTPAGWLRSIRGPKAHAVLSARDPLPFALELSQSARKAARRALTRLRAR